MSDLDAVVVELFTALGERDFERALSVWAPDAVWHLTGEHDLARDYPAEEYLSMLKQWFDDHPDYAVAFTHFERHGEQGVGVHITSTGGRAPGTASGWMLYRVVEGLITEGWAIPTFAQGRHPF